MECLSCKSEMIFWWDAFTSYSCEMCNKSHIYHMTCVPKICPSCSEQNHLCGRCWNKLNKEDYFKEIYEKSQMGLFMFRVWDENKKQMINQPKEFVMDYRWNLFHIKKLMSSGFKIMFFAKCFDKNSKMIFVWDIVLKNNTEYLVILNEFLWFQLVSEKETILLLEVNSKDLEVISNIYEK